MAERDVIPHSRALGVAVRRAHRDAAREGAPECRGPSRNVYFTLETPVCWFIGLATNALTVPSSLHGDWSFADAAQEVDRFVLRLPTPGR